MARIGRIVVPGAVHHITQRGNNRQDVFFVDDDRRMYLHLLHKYGMQFGLQVVGYCLMTNHVHVLGIPARDDSLAKAMGRAHFVYTQCVNRLHGRLGHLWQNRFYSCAMDDAHAWNALAYAELNPVRAGLAREAWAYAWSSAAAHCGMSSPDSVLQMNGWAKNGSVDWKATLVAMAKDDGGQDKIRTYTHTGRPLGSDTFLSKVECLLGRRVRPLPMGRPKGWRKTQPKVDAID